MWWLITIAMIWLVLHQLVKLVDWWHDGRHR